MGKCPVCGISEGVTIIRKPIDGYFHVECSCCGSFFSTDLMDYTFKPKDKNKLSAYLYYHSQKFIPKDSKRNEPSYFLGKKEDFDTEKIPNCTPVTDDIVENWYPKNFSEKIDIILLGLAKQSKYYGAVVSLSPVEEQRAFFIDHIDVMLNR